ncbi:NUDIX domain-containing protein [Candidatus Nomurabacteria bacterium]|nr:NUDIX domain-containing protein [Candidatus Nomurabacteria bacterium]
MTNIKFENKKILDVVNENDEIVDHASRIDIHRLGLLHRQTHIWMFDKDKNIFFQKRGLHTKSAGLLDATVGGHINAGEEYIDAAIRETKEETGISLKHSDLVLIKKLGPLNDSSEGVGSAINKFFCSVYICKNPIAEENLQKEKGIPGGGFQKLSYDFLINMHKEDKKMIKSYVLKKEIPDILNYLNKWKNQY